MKLRLPSWLRRESLELPAWARIKDVPDNGRVSIIIEGDTDGYTREWFELLGVNLADADQYWLEVAYQCAKMDLQMALEGTPFDPRTAGKPAEFHFTRHNHWKQKLHPPGKGIVAASKGLEAREHYRRIRGRLPL